MVALSPTAAKPRMRKLCMSNSGNRGMKKTCRTPKGISNEMYWIFMFVRMMARKI
jgi:hypothetical protein